MTEVIRLTEADIRDSCHRIAAELADENGNEEPIPEFSSRYPGVLESCLETPFQTYDGADLYPSFNEKAAILFYLMVKNHPFANGNKRIAVISLMWFLLSNGYGLSMDYKEMYLFAKHVASSEAHYKAKEIDYIATMLQERRIAREAWLKMVEDGSV